MEHLLVSATEDKRVAPLQPHDLLACLHMFHQQPVNLFLRNAASVRQLSDVNDLLALRVHYLAQRIRRAEMIGENHLGTFQRAGTAQSDQVPGPGASADESDGGSQRISAHELAVYVARLENMSVPHLELTYADALPELVAPAGPEAMPDPELVFLNDPLATELGLDTHWLRSAAGIEFLTAHGVRTVAMGYAGHQFGQYSPRLGDGRALLYGELNTPHGRVNLHAKGTGRTPYSRPGSDGRGTVTSMLRELLYSESLAGLGVETTRTLAVLTTGRTVIRENGPEPAAILVRVARGLSRVGTFQFARSGSAEVTQRLADYEIDRHYPEVHSEQEPYLAFFRRVMEEQADTVAAWMRVGFVHGVMNTDNTSITGETLDFGPCAFTDAWNPGASFSSVDVGGRYQFGNQPAILAWNLARFGETLVDLVDVSQLQSTLGTFGSVFRDAQDHHARLLLGSEATREEIDAYEAERSEAADLTTFHREIAGHDAPLYIPRNHLVAEALASARHGQMTQFEALLNAVADPYHVAAGSPDLTGGAPEDFGDFITFCGT